MCFPSPTVAPMIVTSFHVPPDLCVGFSFIQAESAPVLLSVNVTADPCPTVVWTRNGEPIPEAEATVSLTPLTLELVKAPTEPLNSLLHRTLCLCFVEIVSMAFVFHAAANG